MTTLTDRYQIEIVGNFEAITGAGDQIVKTAQAIKRMERSLRDVDASVKGLDRMRRAIARLLETTDGAAARVSEATRALQRLARVTASADATMTKAAGKIRKAADAAARLETQAMGAARGLDRVQDEATAASRGMDRASDQAGGLGRALGGIAGTAAGTLAGLVSYEAIVGSLRAAFDLLRAGVDAYAETSEEGARAQAEMQGAILSLNAAVGAGVVQSQAFGDIQTALNGVVAESSRITAAFSAGMEALAIVIDGLVTELFGLSGQIDETGQSMGRAERLTHGLTQAIRFISVAAIDATIATQRMIDGFQMIPAVGAYRALTEGLDQYNESLARGARREIELQSLRADTIAAMNAPAFQTADTGPAPGSGPAREAEYIFEPDTSFRVQRPAPRAGRGGGAPRNEFVFDVDEELDAYLRDTAEAARKANALIKQEAEQRLQSAQDAARALAEQQASQIAEAAEAQRLAIADEEQRRAEANQREIEAAQAQAAKLADIRREVARQVGSVSANLLTAGFEDAFNDQATKFGDAAKKIIGNQLVSLGQSAVTAAAVAFVGDPAVGFLPNPARGGALLAAGTAAIAAGTALGASAGQASTAPPRELGSETAVSQSTTNINLSFPGLGGDRRTQARAIQSALRERA